MSDKTLVERLREGNNANATCAAAAIGALLNRDHTANCLGTECRNCINEMIKKLADAIEREYLPRPRFDDGEPVQFGDKYTTDSGKVGTVFRIEYTESQTNIWPIEGDNIGIAALVGDERVKRLKPEVLDAEGVPIKVGDTVWRTDEINGKSRIVKDLYKDGSVITDYEGTIPVCVNPKHLTHKQPDSLELVETDIAEWCIDHAVKGGIVPVNEWVERIKALLERGL